MDAVVLAAAIGGACTLVAAIASPVITYQLTRNRQKRHLIRSGLLQHLPGVWWGRLEQTTGIRYSQDLDVKIEVRGKTVFLTTKMEYKGKTAVVLGEGGLVRGSDLLIHYINKIDEVDQYGSVFFKLSILDHGAKVLEGRYVGQGWMSPGIVSGKILLRPAVLEQQS